MSPSFDLVIAGLGAMGGAAAWQAARRGLRTIGFDRFSPPHAAGSSHGESRITREAYFEDPCYVPVVQRASQLWHELERDQNARLHLPTGGLMIGAPTSTVVAGARASGDAHGLPYEMLDAAAVRARFPALQPEDHMVAVWEPNAGILFPEACVAAQLRAATAAGADLHPDEPVLRWSADGEGVVIETAKRRVRAAALVLAAGAWLTELAPALEEELSVARQVLFWFEPRAGVEAFDPARLPIHIWEWTVGRYFYGFPAIDGLVKVATHGEGEPAHPGNVRREIAPAEVDELRRRLRRFIPDADGAFVRAAVCLYTNTRDSHFLIDRHPEHRQVVVVSACSGHGFKFAPAIGEVAVELARGERTRFDLGLFRWRSATA